VASRLPMRTEITLTGIPQPIKVNGYEAPETRAGRMATGSMDHDF
jgi:hypothetical protein